MPNIHHSDGSREPYQRPRRKNIPVRRPDGSEGETANPGNLYCGEHKAASTVYLRNYDLIDWGKK